jgi:transcriptional regulator with XRE-family HTH domain
MLNCFHEYVIIPTTEVKTVLKLYENIKRLRLEKGMTQDDLARRAGYTDRSSIAKIERGVVDLSQSKIKQFADIFGVTPSTLMGWVDEETSKKNDDLVMLIAKMRKDPEFFEVVSMLAGLPAAEYESIKGILTALGKK